MITTKSKTKRAAAIKQIRATLKEPVVRQKQRADNRDKIASRYLRCLTRGEQSKTGVPDGDGRPSVVFNRVFIDTLKERGGVIEFDLAMSIAGMVQVRDAEVANRTRWEVDPSHTTGISDSTSSGVIGYNPDGKLLSITPLRTTDSKAIWPGWRLVNAVNELQFTGSSLQDAGHVTITPYEIPTREHIMPAVTNSVPLQFLDTNIYDFTPHIISSTVAGPARRGYTVIQVPRDTSYASPYNMVYDASNTAFPQSHPAVKRYRVRYSGLATGATITVTSRVCYQVLVDPDDDTVVGMSQVSEAANQSVLQNLLSSIGSSQMVSAGLNVAYKLVRHAVATRAPQLLPIMDG